LRGCKGGEILGKPGGKKRPQDNNPAKKRKGRKETNVSHTYAGGGLASSTPWKGKRESANSLRGKKGGGGEGEEEKTPI